MATFDELRKRAKSGGNSATNSGTSFDDLRSRAKQEKFDEDVRKVDDSYITLFLDTADRYLSTAKEDYGEVGFSNAYQSYMNRRDSLSDLEYRRDVISKYLENNRDRLDEGSYKGLSDTLSRFGTDASNVLEAFSGKKDYFDQWDTEEEYLSWKDYDEKSKFDLDKGQKEISALEQRKKEVERGRRGSASSYLTGDSSMQSAPYAASQQGVDIDPELADLADQISRKKQYLNQARHIQEGITLSSVSSNADFQESSGYVSTKADGLWDKLTSQYGMGYEDLTYEYINNQNGIRDEIKQKARSYSSDSPFDDGESTFAEKGYDYMNDSEIAIYNYHYAKDGKEAAEAYLDSIQETLNHRKAAGMYQNMEDKTALEIAFGVAAGLDQFESGVKNLFNTEDDYIAQTAIQMASSMVRNDLKTVGPKLPEWLGGASLGQAAYDATTTMSNMAPSVLSSMAANILAPGSGAVVGNSLMFASSAGNAYQEALNLGYDKGQARAYSTLVGASEAGLQYLLGGISSMGGKVSGGAITKMLDGIDNAILRTAGKIGGNMLSEGFEEGLQEVLTPLFKEWALRADEDINWSEVAYSALLGALTAGVMEGPSTIPGEVNTYQTGKQLQEGGISAQRLSEIGSTFAADTVAYQLAGRVDENTGAYTMGRLFNEIGATLTEQNVNDITQALVAKGMSEATAKQNARAMAVVVEGGNLTDRQVKVIEANEVLAEAIRTTIIDSNATWFQRTKGYNEALMALAQEKTAPDDTGTEQLPSNPLARKVGKNTGAYTMAQMLRENGVTLTEQNVQDIAQILVDKGMEEDTAWDQARYVAMVADGKTLRSSLAESLNANRLLADAVRAAVFDSGSALLQRGKARNDSRSAPADVQSETEASSGANVTSISTIRNGVATVKLEDGSEVSVRDVDLDPDEGVRIETIASIEGISTEDANFILGALKATPGASAQMDSLGAKEAYKYGYYGFSQEHITKHGVFANSLSETQRQAIYETGRKARQSQVEKAAPKKATGAKNAQVGKVHFDGDRSALTERQSASLTAMEKVADALGVQIYIFESEVKNGKRIGANGWYDPKDNSIHIDLHAGANGEGTMLFTLAHELTHHIRKWSPEKFKALADFLMEEYGKKGVNVDGMVREQMAKAERNGRTISYDTAFEEVVADSMETMLTDGKVLAKLRMRDQSTWEKIRSFVTDLVGKIRKVYMGLTPDSMEGRYVAEMKDSIERLQELFEEALVDASENYQASLTPGEEGVVVNGSGEAVAYSTEDGTVLLSMRTYEEDGRKAFRDYLNKCVSSKKLTKAEMQEMLDGIEEIYEVCKEFKDKYAPFSSWSDAQVVRNTRGKPVFSVVTPNGDYKMNLDFSLVCKKRRTLDAVFNEMSRRGIIDDFELGQKSVVKINEIIRKYGLETACALCFVDAKRFRQASMADSFVRLYNELVESLVPEDQKGSIDHFNFSGYETIQKVEGGIDTWDNSKLDFSHLDYVMKNYGKGTVEHKAARYIKSNPKGRRLLLRGDFMSSQGFDAVKTQNQDILKLYNSKKGTGGPKAAFGDVQYLNEIIRKDKTWTPAKAYAVGGVRIQSFSDYVPRMVFDYVQMVYDLAATRLPAHAYTKEALFVKQFGLAGIKINMSLIPAIAEGGVAPGLDANGNYVWAGESFDFETAKQIQNAEGYTENCGTICVGVSDRHIRKLLSDPDIRMVIPYHKSGLNPIVAHMNKIAEFTDYTNHQNTTVKETGSKAEKHFDFNKALHDMGKNADPKAVIQQYFDWCDNNGYNPKFADFRDHPNYYKLIEDFTLYDKDGNYVPQREVRAVFPKADSAFGSMKDLIREGLEEDAIVEGKRDKSLSAIVDEIQQTLPRTEAEIEETQVEQADRDLEAEVKLSDRDSDGNRLSEDQVEFFEDSKARDENGNLYVLYHGSRSDLFTEFDVEEGVWLTPDQRYAEIYAEMWHSWRGYEGDLTGLEQSVYADPDYRLYKMYANITKPLNLGEINEEFDRKQMNRLARLLGVPASRLKSIAYDEDSYETISFVYQLTRDKAFIDIAREKGYDGFTATEAGKKTFCAFHAPNQVKLTTNEVPSSFYDIRYSDRDPMAMEESINSLRSEISNIEDELMFAEGDEYRTLRNRLIKLNHDLDKLLAEERKASKKTSLKTVLDNLDKYRRSDLESLAEQLSDGAWDGYEDLDRAELEQGIREIIEERGYSPIEMQSLKYGVYVRPVSDADIRYSDRDLPSVEDYGDATPTGRELWYDIGMISTRIFSIEMDLREAEKGVDLDVINRIRSKLADVKERFIEYGEYVLNNRNKYSDEDILRLSRAFRIYDGWDAQKEYSIEQFMRDLPAKIEDYRKDTANVFHEEMKQNPREDRKLYTAMKLMAAMAGYDVSDAVAESDSLREDDAPFSYRDTESVSNRSLLANALEGAAQNEIERKNLKAYQSKVALIEAEEAKLDGLNERIRELTEAGEKGKVSALRQEAQQTANRISTYDSQLLRLEASKPLKDLLEREKRSAYDRAKVKGEKALAAYKLKAEVRQSETNRDYREVRAALRRQESDTAVMEREFVRIVKAYEKLEAKSGNTIAKLEAKLKEETRKHREDQKTWDGEFRRLLREYEASGRSIAKLEEKIERQKQSAKAKIEGREKTAMRHKVQNVVKELNDLLLNESKTRHVPDSLKKAVAEALELVNMDTVGADDRVARYAELIAKEQAKPNPDQAKIDAYTATMENIRSQGEKMGQRLKDLRDAYEEIRTSGDPDIANAYDSVIADCLKELAGSIGNTSIRDMTIEQLSDVYDMYRMVLTRVRDANKALRMGKSESIRELASRVVGEVRKAGGSHPDRVAMLDPVRKFGWNNLKPVYAFERIGSETLTEAYNAVRAGEDTWAKDVTEARAFFLEQSRKYGYDSWDFETKHRFHGEFELSLGQMLSMYAYAKREQALEHLRLGGFVFDSNIETVKGKGKLRYKVNTADAHQVPEHILAEIIRGLTAEQKAFVDEMQAYLSSTMGTKGNEVTMAMYGVKLFKEKFYFPLKSAKQFMFEQNEVSGEVRIKNSGFTNKTITKANNPVILSNFMDVWAGHVNDMSMYHAFVLPLEDFNRIFNWNSPKQEGLPPVSVKGTIQNAYTPAAVSYVKELITDLNGGARTDSTTGVINKMMGLFKKGSVFASLSVVVQQPSSIARAAALVDTKYFIGPKVGQKRHKALWNEVKQYAPVAIIKEMGYFDTNMGKSTQDFITGKEYHSFGEKMKALVTDGSYRDEILSKAPALADEIAWCSIWEAVKRETQAKNKGMDVRSEAFLKKAGARFTEVVAKTQVYDSVLSRSANMRSKDTGMKMMTAFMAEPTTSINMIADALVQGKRGNRRYARATIGAVIASQIFNSILVSFVYAGRDDDKDKSYWEKYIGTLSGEVLDSLNPAGYIPFVKDIMSIVQGYDVERSDMAVISDLWNAWKKLGSENLSVYRKVEGFAGSLAQIFGLPVKNIMRDARGIYQTVDSFMGGNKTTAAGIGYAVKESVPKWLGGGEVKNQKQLYEAIISGDQEHLARVKARYKDETAVSTAIRQALRENDPRIREATQAQMNGNPSERVRIAKLIIADGFSQDDVVRAINAEINALTADPESSSAKKEKGFYTAEDFAREIANGDQASANAAKTDIIRTAERNGKTAEEAEKSFNSSAKSELKELFLAGEISEQMVISALTTYCGVDEDAAVADVQYWAFKQDYPDVYADDSWFDKYYEEVADSGISIDQYMAYRSRVKDITGEGKKEKRMEVIDSMPISDEQKDALYFAEEWAESKLREAPWH